MLDFFTVDNGLSCDVPFCHLQRLQFLHHGYTKAYLCSLLYPIPFSTTAKVTICSTHIMALVRDLVAALLVEALLMPFFEWLEVKRKDFH